MRLLSQHGLAIGALLSWREGQAFIEQGETTSKELFRPFSTFVDRYVVLTTVEEVIANGSHHPEKELDFG